MPARWLRLCPTPHGEYFYKHTGKFSITLTAKSGKSIVSGKPADLQRAGRLSKDELGRLRRATARVSRRPPGAGRPSLSLQCFTYTEKHANLVAIAPVFGHVTHERAIATVTGTVESPKLITGTVEVHGNGCSLATSSYRARSAKV